jgi:hypothetical protein
MRDMKYIKAPDDDPEISNDTKQKGRSALPAECKGKVVEQQHKGNNKTIVTLVRISWG